MKMFVTRRSHGAKPQVKGAHVPACQPNPMTDRPHFKLVQTETWWIRSDVDSQKYPMPRVSPAPRFSVTHEQGSFLLALVRSVFASGLVSSRRFIFAPGFPALVRYRSFSLLGLRSRRQIRCLRFLHQSG
jgi:hypothetical protein